MFVMISSALWLMLTVTVLNIHHKNPQKYPPSWLERIATHIPTNFICMSKKKPSTKYKKVRKAEPNIYNGLSQYVQRVGFLTWEEKQEPVIEPVRLSWIKVAKILDRFFLIIFLLLDMFTIILFICFYPYNTGKFLSPKYLPREEIHWNFTE